MLNVSLLHPCIRSASVRSNLVSAAGLLMALFTPGLALAEPDLIIRDFDVVPAMVAPGGTVTVSADVYNNDLNDVASGTLTAGGNGYMVDLVLSTDQVAPVRWATYDPAFSEDVLLRNGRVSRTANVDFYNFFEFMNYTLDIPEDTPPGDYFLCAVVDPGRRIAESNEGNNVRCREIQVVAAPQLLPDFVASLEGMQTQCADGRNVETLFVNLSNQGPGTFPFPIDIDRRPLVRMSLISGEDSISIGTFTITREMVPGDGSASITRLGHQRYDGFYGRKVQLHLEVDPDEAIEEADEANNVTDHFFAMPPLECG